MCGSGVVRRCAGVVVTSGGGGVYVDGVGGGVGVGDTGVADDGWCFVAVMSSAVSVFFLCCRSC